MFHLSVLVENLFACLHVCLGGEWLTELCHLVSFLNILLFWLIVVMWASFPWIKFPFKIGSLKGIETNFVRLGLSCLWSGRSSQGRLPEGGDTSTECWRMNRRQPDGEERGIRSLAWWSSGEDAMLPMQGTWVWSLIREPDPTNCN